MPYNKDDMYAQFVALVELHVGPKRKDQVLKLLEYQRDKGGFFSAPASSKKQFHMAEHGGLAMHSWNFIQVFLGMLDNVFGAESMTRYRWGNTPDKSATDMRTLKESAVIIGLCHDLNKTKLFGSDYYLPNMTKQSGYSKPSESEPYKTSDRTALGSLVQVALAMSFIDLKPDEIQAIRYAEGLYDYSYRGDIGNKEEFLTILAHHADMQSSQIIEWCNPWTRDHTTWNEHLQMSPDEDSVNLQANMHKAQMPLEEAGASA